VHLILASASPRRSELLGRAGIAFEILPADVDESVRPGETPRAYVARVAEAKAELVRRGRPEAWVLAADTTVVVDGDILAKAADETEAARMLARLGGRAHEVMTATCLLGPGAPARRLVETEVVFRPIGDGEVTSYVRGGEWRGKAGAYGAQGQAAAFIVAIHGSFTNVIGLPLAETLVDLAARGIAAPRYEP
jgi:septum formation protein